MSNERHPMQPIIETETGTIRFKRNKIVDDLLEFASARGMSLNEIAVGGYSQDDQEQFAQLIGYSVNGFHELSYVSDRTAKKASRQARKLNPKAGGCRDTDCMWHCGVKREE